MIRCLKTVHFRLKATPLGERITTLQIDSPTPKYVRELIASNDNSVGTL